MKNATHRVIILKNCNSDLISQAIFFLRDDSASSESKILAEAEKIVEKYMSEQRESPPQKSRKSPVKWKKRLNIYGISAVAFVIFFLTILYLIR